jgi:hypothetical protein
MKSPDAAVAPAAKKTSRKRGCGKKSTYTKTRTSAQEVASDKPLGSGKKFSTKSSRLSIAEEALLLGIGAAGRKPKHDVNLFGSNSYLMMRVLLRGGLKNMPGSVVFRSKFRSLFRLEVCFFRTIITNFSCVCLGVAMVPPPSDGDKVPKPQDVLTEKTLIPYNEIVACEGGMINAALASRRGGTIKHDDLCDVLSDCLHDVSFTALMMPYFSSSCWIFICVCLHNRQ